MEFPLLRPPYRAVLIFLTAVSLICTQVPLFNYLGFEFSALLTLFAAYCAGLVTIKEWKQFGKNPDVLLFYRSVSLKTLMLLVLPLLILLVNALFVKNCSLSQGFVLFLLLTVPGILFSNALAIMVVTLVRRLQKTVFTMVVLLVLSHILVKTFATPQIFAFNPLLGFFPGITYDESLNIEGRLALYRFGTLIVAALIVLLADVIMKRRRNIRVASAELFAGSLGFVLVSGFYFFANDLGFSSSERFIGAKLGGVDTTAHFIMYYPKAVVSDEKARELALLHEFYFASIAHQLHILPVRKIRSFVYASPEQKGRLIGAAATDVSKPWLWELHINLGDVDGALKHEMVHVMAAEFGFPLLRVSVNSGLIEGLATAVEKVEYDETLHHLAAQIIALGHPPDMESLFSVTGFMKVHGATSYVLAGSFCRYLIDQYGLRRFKWVYRTGSFRSFYNRDLPELVAEWKRFIAEPGPSDHELYKAAYLFRRPSIFGKECARVIANLNLNTRDLLREKKFEEALASSRHSLDLTVTPEAIFQHASALFQLGNFDATIRFALNELHDSTVAHVLLPLYLTAGDSYWFKGKPDSARQMYETLYSMHLSLVWDETVGLRLASLSDHKRGDVVREFLRNDSRDSAKVKWLKAAIDSVGASPLLQYCLGRTLMSSGRYAEAVAALQSYRSLDTGVLEFVRYRLLGKAYFELEEYQKAKVYFWESLNFTSKPAHQIQTEEWLERCDWTEIAVNGEP